MANHFLLSESSQLLLLSAIVTPPFQSPARRGLLLLLLLGRPQKIVRRLECCPTRPSCHGGQEGTISL